MTIAPWTAERVERLRAYVATGMTCSQIAAEIGVTRNAVIGKIHRLGLSTERPAPAPAGSCQQRARRPRLLARRQLLRLVSPEAPGGACEMACEPVSVDSAQRCSLLELAQGKCRWPIGDGGSDSSAADFVFCGNEAAAGFSYCAGHARMAYRLPARRRA
jgi:GcrA cell cycle regulator